MNRLYQFAPKVACLFLEIRKKVQKVKNPKKIVMSSSPGKGGSCSSESKHDLRMGEESKLFVSKRRLQKQRLQPRDWTASVI
jgi:hypothetical protein